MRRRLSAAALLVPALAATAPAAAQSFRVDGTEFVVERPRGDPLRSRDLIGAELQMPDGARLRLDAVVRETAADGSTVWLHQLSVLEPDGAALPLCEPDAQGLRLAIALQGAYSEDSRYHARPGEFAFSCSIGVQAKCVRLGYAPWTLLADGSSKADLFQACTRMMRADYCGNGEPHTRNGTLIDVSDTAGIRPFDGDPLVFEAGWRADGAVCVHHVRIPALYSLPELARACPRVADAALHGEDCTEAVALRHGALLINRSAPAAP